MVKKSTKKFIFFCEDCSGQFRLLNTTKKFYNESYFKKCYIGDDNDDSRFHIAKRCFDQFGLDNYSGKLLEIGCAGGHFLRYCKIKGFTVLGIEIGKSAADYAKNKFKLNVINDDVETAVKTVPDNSFDCIVMINLLENVKKPLNIMIQLNRILKKDGVVILIVPNYSSLFKKDYPALRVSFFNPKSIRKMSKISGFKIVMFRTRFFSYIADMSLQKLLKIFNKNSMKVTSNNMKDKIKINTSKFATFLDWIDRTERGNSILVILKKEIL